MIQDLGRIEKSVVVFGGAYSNYQATLELQKMAASMGVLPERIVSTGDMVAYCGQPRETIDLIRDWSIRGIAGNVEKQVSSGQDGCGCDFDKGSACDLLSSRWYGYIQKEVTDNQREWMGVLPDFIRFEMNGSRIMVVHGSVTHISAHIFRSTPWEMKEVQFGEADVDVIIGGHCGMPFYHQRKEKLWINAGVLGMPANDGTSRTWYLVVEPETTGIRFSLKPLGYNFDQAARIMEAAGLPAEYAGNLRDGLWHDCTQLPEEERKRRGVPLAFESLFFDSTESQRK